MSQARFTLRGMRYSRDHYRSLAIARRRDPELDSKLADASARMKRRFEEELDKFPLIRELKARAAADERSVK